MSIIQENVPLITYNTFHLDIKARYMADLKEISEIREFLASPYSQIRPRLILGGGSNILFTADYDGMIIRPVIKGIERTGGNKDHMLIRAGAGVNWDSFVAWCVSSDMGGIENLSLIPGTVGASPVQNIGAYGVEIRDVIHAVEAVSLDNGEMIMLSGEECRFGYRDSIFKNELRNKVIITSVTYRFKKTYEPRTDYTDLARELNIFPEVSVKTIREAVIAIRRNKLPDPDEIGNAGSFFKNPAVGAEQVSDLRKAYPGMPVYQDDKGNIKLSAAWLIDQCGWKGIRQGNTGTYQKQPLILVNHGSATGSEILDFAQKIQKSVLDRFGIRLDLEVNVAGD
jgi:UDP-N-acetylmuramate dehydrogenase